MSVHQKALDSMFNDLDDFESKKIFGGDKEPKGNEGMSVTITLTPNESQKEEQKVEGISGHDDLDDIPDLNNLPEDHPASMCKGGCVKHMALGGTVGSGGMNQVGGMAGGGVVQEPTPSMGETEDLSLPPFLRKKKNSSNR